jgi:hypothetical protein
LNLDLETNLGKKLFFSKIFAVKIGKVFLATNLFNSKISKSKLSAFLRMVLILSQTKGE